jgi:glutamine synthetase
MSKNEKNEPVDTSGRKKMKCCNDPSNSEKPPTHVGETKTNLTHWNYVWLAGDGTIRSARYFSVGETPKIQRFDGSACKQASVDNADLFLVPVRILGPSNNRGIVLCEVQTADGTPHATNSRASLHKFISKNDMSNVHIGFEQEILFIDPDTRQPYRWPTGKDDKGETQVIFPGPQGRYYGGSGDFQRGREIFDRFTNICLETGIELTSQTAGICLSQWSYSTKETDILTACDTLVLTRYLLEIAAESSEKPRCVISYQPKSFPGTEWNGNACNIRIYMNDRQILADNARHICETIGKDHSEHMASYGSGNETRLVGKTQGTSDFNKFTWGFGDRSASLCVTTIPVTTGWCGKFPTTTVSDDTSHLIYIEDRRPSANMDPYLGVLALSRSLVNVVNSSSTTTPIKSETFKPKLVN